MSPYSILQEGHLRRRRLRQRRSPTPPGPVGRRPSRPHSATGAFLLLGLVLCLVALLAFMAGRATGPTLRPAHVRHATAVAGHIRGDYGLALAPREIQVHLKLPLKSGMLFDVRTGRVLWERNAQAIVPIASLTKMMTALVVVSRLSPNATALITPQAVHFSGSGVGLLPLGKHALVRTLLYGLMLPSGNDAAIALAQRVAGSVDRFIALMNAHARAMGMSCTHFTTVSGVIDQGNYSCAPDLALLAHAVLEQPLLARIVGSRSAVMPLPIKGGKLWLYNNNPLYGLGYPGTDGVKTGYTTLAGQCLVATARRGRAWLGVVLLHSGNTGEQAETLLNAGFAAHAS